MRGQPEGDALAVLLKQLRQYDPYAAAAVEMAPFRSVMMPRRWAVGDGLPEVEAVVLIDGQLTGGALARLIEVIDAAEANQRAIILISEDASLRNSAKQRLAQALNSRRQAGGRA